MTATTGWAVITGASSGLGAIFAERLAAQGHPLLLSGRDERRLTAVAARVRKLSPGVEIRLCVEDLGSRAGQDRLIAAFTGLEIAVLVNNAGFATYGPFVDGDPTRSDEMIDVNVMAVQRIATAALPGMLARGRGGVINVASTIAFQPGPFHAVYAATKAFTLSFSQALWTETLGTGVTVTALCPGPTDTGFVAALDADVSGTPVYRRLAAPGPVVDAGLRGLRRGRPVVVPGVRNRLLALSSRLAPAVVVNRIAARMMRPAAPAPRVLVDR